MEVSSSMINKKVKSIPEDIIIIELLSRLPVKTLLRFKVVCKTWYSFINSHTFKLIHHNFCTVSHLLINKRVREECNRVFSFRSNDKLMNESLPDLQIPADPNRNVYVAGSCNGIVCYYDCTSTIFLCNPATREFKQLPPTSLQLDVKEFCCRDHAVGFGFDSSNIYDFKVLRVFCEVGTYKAEIRAEMFTLSSNTWRQLDWGLNNNQLVFRGGMSLFFANSFHFIMRYPYRPFYVEDSMEDTIMCCDIRSEKFKTINFPLKPNHDNGYFKMLMAFKGCLSSVLFKIRNPIDIWVMKDYGVESSWTKLYTIGPCSIPLCFYMDEDDLLLVQFQTKNLVSCHLNTLDIGTIQIGGNKLDDGVIVYKETLVSIM